MNARNINDNADETNQSKPTKSTIDKTTAVTSSSLLPPWTMPSPVGAATVAVAVDVAVATFYLEY